MDFKLCKGCKEMILLNSKAYCSKCQAKYKKEVYESKGMNDPQLIYNKGRYKKARQQCMNNANGLCEVCYYYGIRRIARHCHHIIKVVDGNDNTHYDSNNLVAVCHKCHDKIEGRSKEEIIEALESGKLKEERENI